MNVIVIHQLFSNTTEVKLTSRNKYEIGKSNFGVVYTGINVAEGR